MVKQRRKRLNYMPLEKLSIWASAALMGLSYGLEARADSSVNVPLDHWVYAYVERLEAQGRIIEVGDGIKPLSRNEIAGFINLVYQSKEITLSAVELGELALLRGEFSNELRPLQDEKAGGEDLWSRLRRGHSLLHYQADEGELFVDLLFRQQTDRFSGRGRVETEMIYRNRVGGIIRGQLGGHIGFRLGFEQVREQGSRDYFFRQALYERWVELPQLKGNLADFHEGTAYLTFDLGPVDVELGKDEVLWGPAPGGNLGLSNGAPSFNMIRLKSRLGAFKLVSIAGELRPCPDRPDSPLCGGLADSAATYIINGISRPLDREKYLAAHRLEVALAPWIDLGFQEVVVYGDRGPELSYVNPLMFYWAAQSYLGDKDNVMMGVDLDIHPGNGRRYYLSYVVDDLKKLGIFSDDFSNKFSLQTGMLWVDPLGLGDAELRAEYLRIEPWIYSHKFPINTFRHFDAPLGHSLSPNSDQWQVGLTKRLSRDWSFNFKWSRRRPGENEVLADGSIRNVGGDMHYGWRPGDERESKKFLDGRLERRRSIAGGTRWRIGINLQLEVEYVHEWGDQVPLPPAWGPGVPLEWRTGYGEGTERHLRFDLRYNYF